MNILSDLWNPVSTMLESVLNNFILTKQGYEIIGAAILILIIIYVRKRLRKKGKDWGYILSPFHALYVCLFVAILIICDKLNASVFDLVIDLTILSSCAFVFTMWRRKKVFICSESHKLDSANNWLQLSVLITIGVIIFKIIISCNFTQHAIPIAAIGTVLTWVFQDAIKGTVTYIHLKINHLLYIGDVISIAEKNIIGYVSDISLVSVTIDSLDNTKCNIPISSFQTGSFNNLKKMIDGKTSGRQFRRVFTINNNSIKEFNIDMINKLIDNLEKRGEDTTSLKCEAQKMVKRDIKGVLNIYLYRKFIRYHLYNSYDISRNPRLIISTLEPTVEGTPFEIYTYIKRTHLEPFEQTISDLSEYVILSMQWFGLKLYQRPDSYDINELSKKEQEDNE